MALAFLASGCTTTNENTAGSDEEFDIPPILRVGVLADASRTDPSAKANAELLALLEKSRGIIVDIEKYSCEEILFALRRGDVDLVAAGLTDTEIAAEFLSPCARFFPTGRRVAVNASLSAFITDLHQLDNPKVTVYTVAGSVSANTANSIFKQASIASLKDMHSCLSKVRSGTGSVLLVGPTEGWNLFKRQDSAKNITGLNLVLGPLSKEHLAWAVRKSDQRLATAMDAFVAELRKKGKLDKIIAGSGVDTINK